MSAIGSGVGRQLADHSRLGRAVVLSAMLPLDASGHVVDGGIREQTRRALERLRDAATRAGVSIATGRRPSRLTCATPPTSWR